MKKENCVVGARVRLKRYGKTGTINGVKGDGMVIVKENRTKPLPKSHILSLPIQISCDELELIEPHQNDEFLCSQNDLIDNSVFDAIQSVAYNKIDWNMELIGEVTMCIEKVLTEHKIPICHPWQDDDENICYSTEDRCEYCRFNQGGNT